MRKKQVDNSNPVVPVVCHLVTSAVARVLPVVIVVSVVVKITSDCLLTVCHRQAKLEKKTAKWLSEQTGKDSATVSSVLILLNPHWKP